MSFTDTMTLAEARDELRGLVYEGEKCPCCTQFAKVYKRIVHSTMARGLIKLHRAPADDPEGFVHLPSLLPRTAAADIPKARYWGLLVEQDVRREDGGRAGMWKLTPAGSAWVLGRTTIKHHAYVYDNKVLGFDGDDITVQDALGKKFNYHDLMTGAL